MMFWVLIRTTHKKHFYATAIGRMVEKAYSVTPVSCCPLVCLSLSASGISNLCLSFSGIYPCPLDAFLVFLWRNKKNINTFFRKKKCLIWSYDDNYVPHLWWGEHIDFGVDPVGVGVCVDVTLSCLHNVLWISGYRHLNLISTQK